MTHRCAFCNSTFSRARQLKLHRRSEHPNRPETNYGTFKCGCCYAEESYFYELMTHFRDVHDILEPSFCAYCNTFFENKASLIIHQATQHGLPNLTEENIPPVITPTLSAIQGSFTKFDFTVSNQVVDLFQVLRTMKTDIRNILSECLRQHHNLKIYMSADVSLHKLTTTEGEKTCDVMFKTDMEWVDCTGLRDSTYDDLCQDIVGRLSQFCSHGSGWIVTTITKITLGIVGGPSSLRGSSYIATPPIFRNSPCVTNIQNLQGADCFLLHFLAARHPEITSNRSRPTTFERFLDEVNGSYSSPMPIHEIDRFESLNSDVAINVYGYSPRRLSVLRHSPRETNRTVINMMLITNGNHYHYILINSLDLVVKHFRHIRVGNNHESRACTKCLHLANNSAMLEMHHNSGCKFQKPLVINMPTGEKAKIRFTQHTTINLDPLVLYTDFECLSRPIQGPDLNPAYSGTRDLVHEVPSEYSIMGIREGGYETVFEKNFRGESDIIGHFIQDLRNIGTEIVANMNTHRQYIGDRPNPSSYSHCCICKAPFLPDDLKCLDHCHYWGDFKGYAHASCNLNRPARRTVSVFAHNLKNFDLHLICRRLEVGADDTIDIIPQTKEKYLCFTLTLKVGEDVEGRPITFKFKFLDSFSFLPSSLETLAKNLEPEDFSYFDTYFQLRGFSIQQINKLKRKGVFPYSYVDSFQKFDETQLPPREEWVDSLKDGGVHVTPEDVAYATDIFREFGCRTLGEYQTLYLTVDVLLLGCIFTKFRDVCYRNYELDCVQYFSASHLTWHAMLKHTGEVISLLEDRVMLDMAENLKRGGLASVYRRRGAKANNWYLPDYDPTKDPSYILMWDVNSLYG